MKCLVIYDSIFGNTEKVARAIGNALESISEVEIVSVNSVNSIDTQNLDLLIVGSPTRGFRPTKPVTMMLRQFPGSGLKNIKVAAFDTRVRITDVNSAFLTFMVNLFGYAAQPIANGLKSKGGNLVAHPEGFYVEDREGPLFIGELDRAQTWAKQLLVD
jgi:flavodoxin